MSTITDIAHRVADSVTLGDEDQNGTCSPIIEDIDHLAAFIEQGIEAYIAELVTPEEIAGSLIRHTYRENLPSTTQRLLREVAIEAATLALKGKVK